MIRGRIARHATINPDVVGATGETRGSPPSGKARAAKKSARAGVASREQPSEEDNEALVKRLLKVNGIQLPAVVLLGGSDLLHVRARNAQSRARLDLLPSFWSLAGVLTDSGKTGQRVITAGTDGHASLAAVPGRNAICEQPLARYKSRVEFPNIAVLEFPVEDASKFQEGIDYLTRARLALDLVGPLAHWLTYLWGVDRSSNPLLAGIPEPSALFVDRVFGYAGVDITPGLAEPVVCPEAIWQAALWWRDFYADEETAAAKPRGKKASKGSERAKGPRGFHVIGQRAAAVSDDEEHTW